MSGKQPSRKPRRSVRMPATKFGHLAKQMRQHKGLDRILTKFRTRTSGNTGN